jgi:hypothetical protein
MKTKKVIIACDVMRRELEFLAKKETNIEFRFLEQGLHDTPQKMSDLIQEQVDQVQEYASQIILGYGLCSNGIVGVTAPKQELIIPKVHDCIALFMGSRSSYTSYFHEHPATYYLTSGWVDCGGDPLSYMEADYVPKLGREKAEWGIKLEFKDYKSFVFIDHYIFDVEAQKEKAKENASYFGFEYIELDGKLDLLKKILFGPYDDDFLIFQPSEIITGDILYQLDK